MYAYIPVPQSCLASVSRPGPADGPAWPGLAVTELDPLVGFGLLLKAYRFGRMGLSSSVHEAKKRAVRM